MNFRGGIKVEQDKGMLPALGDFVSQFSVELQDSFTFPHTKKRKKIAIYRENKILSHGLYNWAYTLFTA